MTTTEMLARIRSALHEELGGFYLTGTATGGSVTTLIDGALVTFADDYFNDAGAEALITSGGNAGLRRAIADFVSASYTATFLEQFPYAISSGITYEIGQKGFFSDQELLAWLNDGSYEVIRLLANDALWDYLKTADTAGTTVSGQDYGRALVPSDMIKPPASIWVNGKTSQILMPDQKTRFDRDPYIGAAVLLEGRPGSVQRVLYKPNDDATLQWQYAPTPTTIRVSAATNLPARLHNLLCDYGIMRAWQKAERADLAKVAEGNFSRQVQSANTEALGRMGLS